MEAGSSSNTGIAGSDGSGNKKILNHRETLAVFRDTQLIGREKEKSEILKLVLNEDSQQLEVISLWGMGGIGKTTLVRDVYQELSGKFEKRACVTILRPFSLDKLIEEIAMQIGCEVKKMVRYLEGKKYLIVLDDLSSNTEWDTIIPQFPAMETSSRIIVTTRIKDIANHCSNKHKNICELQRLGHRSARDLFMKKVWILTSCVCS